MPGSSPITCDDCQGANCNYNIQEVSTRNISWKICPVAARPRKYEIEDGNSDTGPEIDDRKRDERKNEERLDFSACRRFGACRGQFGEKENATRRNHRQEKSGRLSLSNATNRGQAQESSR